MPESLAGPVATALALPAGVECVEFISDLHLSPELPRTTAAFEAYLAGSSAQVIFILGDLFEAWVGDDMLTQPYESRCARALRAAAQRCAVYVMRGNRDFLIGPRFFAETGCLAADDPMQVQAPWGETLLLSHGDALCLDDVDYQRFRAQVRAPGWQAAFLARPLAERLAVAAQMRAASQAHQGGQPAESYADVDAALSLDWLQRAGAATLLHGHTHRPTTECRPEGWRRVVLSDWDLDHGQRAEVLRWTARGFERLAWPH